MILVYLLALVRLSIDPLQFPYQPGIGVDDVIYTDHTAHTSEGRVGTHRGDLQPHSTDFLSAGGNPEDLFFDCGVTYGLVYLGSSISTANTQKLTRQAKKGSSIL